jgi:hypothetical protein
LTDTTTTDLTQQLAPLSLPARALAYRGELWQPVLVSTLGLGITGGPTGLSILRLFSRQQVWYSITPQVWLSGFAVNGTTLYVQDGPVLCQWDLSEGTMDSAVNLVTQKTWASSQGTLTDSTRTALYALSTDLTAKQQALQKARNQAAWADLMEEADAAEAALTAREQLDNVQSMARALRTMAGATDATKADPALIQKLRDALTAAESDAAAVIFSAPRVRTYQLESLAGGSLFSLARDGTLHALDDALSHVGTSKLTAPVSSDLAMYEDASVTTGQVPCVLAYLTAAGALQVVNVAVSPPQVVSSWAGAGGLASADGLLPLTCTSGYFWGGGIPSHGIFGIPVGAVSSGPTVGLDGTWTDYEISSRESLALSSDGLNTRLRSFAAGTQQADRWGLLTASAEGWTSFWRDDDLTTASAARLVLQVEKDGTTQSPAGLNLRTYVANTVDDPDGETIWWTPTVLAARVLRPGGFSGTFARLRAPVTVYRDTLYALIGSATPQQQLVALTTVSNGSSGWTRFQEANSAQYATGANGAWDLGACPLPTLATTDQLAVFSLAALKETAMPLATAELAKRTQATVKCAVTIRILFEAIPSFFMPLQSTQVTITYQAPPVNDAWTVTTNDSGAVTVKVACAAGGSPTGTLTASVGRLSGSQKVNLTGSTASVTIKLFPKI